MKHGLPFKNDKFSGRFAAKFPVRKLPMLCHEIREKIISAVSDNGGHLASNLRRSGTYGCTSSCI